MATVISKSLFASKTVWVNVISGITLFLEGQDVLNILPDPVEPYIVALVFGLNIILRYITVQPVTVSGGEKVIVPSD